MVETLDGIDGVVPKFDYKAEMEKLRKTSLKRRSLVARKLAFSEQCAAFAAMYCCSAQNQIVARAFGISRQTASYIAGCLERDPNPTRIEEKTIWRDDVSDYKIKGARELVDIVDVTVPDDHNEGRDPNRQLRYQNIAREFRALGEDEFSKRYLTEDVFRRIRQAVIEIRDENRWKLPDNFNDWNTVKRLAWRDKNPEKWEHHFPENNPPTPIDREND